eukprot:4179133-Prymnesium_polylepis.1
MTVRHGNDRIAVFRVGLAANKSFVLQINLGCLALVPCAGREGRKEASKIPPVAALLRCKLSQRRRQEASSNLQCSHGGFCKPLEC